MKKTKSKLIPVDMKRCQAEFRSFMTFGPGMTRCSNKPVWVATETKPNSEDGEIGAMSLCEDCTKRFRERMPHDYATFSPIVEITEKRSVVK